jgi:hypothetical protein
MKRAARSAMVTGVTMLTASAVVIAPVLSTQQQAPEPTVRLIASVQPTRLSPQPLLPTSQRRSSETLIGPSVAATDLPNLLVGWLEGIVQHYVVPPSASRPFPTPQFPPVVGGTSIGSSIKNIYNAVEPWVEWGFDVAAYAVGWVPYVGWLAPQIEIFYNFGERIVRSITFNIADWLDGTISFGQGLLNVGVDTVNAFIQLGIDQWNFWLWPLPPLPPIFPLAVEPETEELTIALSNEESLESESFEALKEEGEVIDEFEGARVERLGEELTQGEELIEGGEIEDVLPIEEADVDLTVNMLTDDGEIKDEVTAQITTDTSGTVQAQGEIRESAIATPTGASPQAQNTNGIPAGDPNGEPTEQTPSTNVDEPQNTADPEPGEGTVNTADE